MKDLSDPAIELDVGPGIDVVKKDPPGLHPGGMGAGGGIGLQDALPAHASKGESASMPVAAFAGHGLAVVFVPVEAGMAARPDMEGDDREILGFGMGGVRREGKERAGANEQGDEFQGCVGDVMGSAVEPLASPEVVPMVVGQVHNPGG